MLWFYKYARICLGPSCALRQVTTNCASVLQADSKQTLKIDNYLSLALFPDRLNSFDTM